MYSKASIHLAEQLANLTGEEREKLTQAIFQLSEPVMYSNQDFDRLQHLGSLLYKPCKSLTLG